MNQQKLFHNDIYDAVRDAVTALGGSKEVGHMLWPTKGIQEAGKLLDRCLDSDRAEKLSLQEFEFIMQRSANKGCHTIANHLGMTAYYKFIPIEPEDEKAELMREFNSHVELLDGIQKRMAQLNGS